MTTTSAGLHLRKPQPTVLKPGARTSPGSKANFMRIYLSIQLALDDDDDSNNQQSDELKENQDPSQQSAALQQEKTKALHSSTMGVPITFSRETIKHVSCSMYTFHDLLVVYSKWPCPQSMFDLSLDTVWPFFRESCEHKQFKSS